MERLLSTGDVARMWGVSPTTIRRWIHERRIAYVEVGNARLKRRMIRISKTEADKYLRQVPAGISDES